MEILPLAVVHNIVFPVLLQLHGSNTTYHHNEYMYNGTINNLKRVFCCVDGKKKN